MLPNWLACIEGEKGTLPSVVIVIQSTSWWMESHVKYIFSPLLVVSKLEISIANSVGLVWERGLEAQYHWYQKNTQHTCRSPSLASIFYSTLGWLDATRYTRVTRRITINSTRNHPIHIMLHGGVGLFDRQNYAYHIFYQ